MAIESVDLAFTCLLMVYLCCELVVLRHITKNMARPNLSDIRAKRQYLLKGPRRSVLSRRPLMTARTPDAEPLLTPAEVATMFRVDPKTVTRWAKAGKLTSIRTLGGHRRYREAEVRALLAGIPQQRTEG